MSTFVNATLGKSAARGFCRPVLPRLLRRISKAIPRFVPSLMVRHNG